MKIKLSLTEKLMENGKDASQAQRLIEEEESRIKYKKEMKRKARIRFLLDAAIKASTILAIIIIFLSFYELVQKSEYSTSGTLTHQTSKVRDPLNYASALEGAFVVESQSSKTVSPGDDFIDSIYNFFGAIDSGFVLLDTRNPVPKKGWCSSNEKPVLTIRLSKFIIPKSISYQHYEWIDIAPKEAPKKFNVVGCLNSICNNTVLLVSGWEYKHSIIDSCPVTNYTPLPINKIQIHFLENHGNVEKTCAYLFRVHGDPVDNYVQEDQDSNEVALYEFYKNHGKPKHSQRSNCTDVAWEFNHFQILYKARRYTCPHLFAENCCLECPECCEKCEMQTGYRTLLASITITLWIIMVPVSIIFLLLQGGLLISGVKMVDLIVKP